MEPIASDIAALAKKLTPASFKPLSDGIGLVSFKQTPQFSWEQEPSVTQTVQPTVPQQAKKVPLEIKPDLKKTSPLQFKKEEEKAPVLEELPVLVAPAKSNVIRYITKLFLAHLIDLVFILALLSCAFLVTDFFLMPQERTSFFEQIKKIILSFPKEWGGFLLSVDGFLVTYLLFFVYMVFFRFTAGGSIGSFLSKR